MPGLPHRFDVAEALRLRAAGKSAREVGELLGVRAPAIRKATKIKDGTNRGGNVGDQTFLKSCTCGHLGRWHRGGTCRITGCECEAFVWQTVKHSSPDGSWMPRGRS